MKLRRIPLILLLVLNTTQVKSGPSTTTFVDKFPDDHLQTTNNLGLPRYGHIVSMIQGGVEINDPSGYWTEVVQSDDHPHISLVNKCIQIEINAKFAVDYANKYPKSRLPKLVLHSKQDGENSQYAMTLDKLRSDTTAITVPVANFVGADPQLVYAVSVHGMLTIYSIGIVDDQLDIDESFEHDNLGSSPGNLVPVRISKPNFFNDAYLKIMNQPVSILANPLLAIIYDETGDGIDDHVSLNDFFDDFAHELVNPHWNLFKVNNHGLVQVDSESINEIDHTARFRFVGRVIGMAIVHRYTLKLEFIPSLFKLILKEPIELDDIEAIDIHFYRIITTILDADLTSLGLDIAFKVEKPANPVSPDQSATGDRPKFKPLTNQNKIQLIQKSIQNKIKTQLEPAISALRDGLQELVPKVMSMTAHDLDVLISGRMDLDIAEWEQYTEYLDFTRDQELLIRDWVWDCISEWPEPMVRKLLLLTTGNARLPPAGFKAIFGTSADLNLFLIKKSVMVRAGIQFHPKLDGMTMPMYASYQELQEQLTRAVKEKKVKRVY